MSFKSTAAALALLCIGAAPMRFTAPMQPWTSPDGRVSLLRPATAQPTTSDAAISTLMSPGWRLVWNDKSTPGRMIVRLTMKVAPEPRAGTAIAVFQIGSSAAPAAVGSCLRYGLDSGSGDRQPDRVINGVRYGVWRNGDAGMSQGIGGTDLRAVVGGRCYAVERYNVSESASAGDPSVTLSQKAAAAQFDASLASLRIDRGTVSVPAVQLPPGPVAR